MKAALLTREYPPDVYGGAGVHVAMVAGVAGCDLVHSHTWYANLAGHLAKLAYAIPHVVTAHSGPATAWGRGPARPPPPHGRRWSGHIARAPCEPSRRDRGRDADRPLPRRRALL